MHSGALGGIALTVAAVCVASCGDTAKLSESQGMGPQPVLPAASPPLFPTINIATPNISTGRAPIAAPSLKVRRYADHLDHPRWIYVLPNGDVLVAESNAPAEHNCGAGIEGWIEELIMQRMGAGTRSADKISLLRESADGTVQVYPRYLTGLKSPFGMALVGGQLYVANTDAILRFPYDAEKTEIAGPGEKVRDLPAGCINYHWTKNILPSKDDKKLYVTVGSNSDHGQRGPDSEKDRARIWELDLGSGSWQPFATGLRNPNGLAWEPSSGTLWTTVNERDRLGSDLVPDYLTEVRRGGFYGWPCYYYGRHLDARVSRSWECFNADVTRPDYALGNHTASLGLAFAKGELLPREFRNGAFIAQHGSWNRKPWSGYKVIFVPFEQGKPHGVPIDVLWGFRDGDDAVLGRPVGVAIDKRGALLVSDDVGNVIWRVAP